MKDLLFKRYGDPLLLLRTYSLRDTADFILWLFEEQQEEALREQWLHTQMTQSFNEFKKQQGVRKGRNQQTKTISKEEQEKALAFAYQFIKPNDLPESEVRGWETYSH
ncbi:MULTISPECIES: peptide methionine sulfoxide reductase [unclassified Enterococcus]|uniref:peptide methionine sulfoxide reductase n=1 Tax=unclassified Enterococcus TaxID=2608891 RepID=UPI001F15662D|nr:MULTISPECIES: peptide methionine sulfoxide reductase [unclassified Enterococcus]